MKQFIILVAILFSNSLLAQSYSDHSGYGYSNVPQSPHEQSDQYRDSESPEAIYSVEAGEYCDFLNAVAAEDPYHLYNTWMEVDGVTEVWSKEESAIIRSGDPGHYTYSVYRVRSRKCPNPERYYTIGSMAYIDWLSGARYCNWLQHGRPHREDVSSDTTEVGAYTLNGAKNGSYNKNENAKYYVATPWWSPHGWFNPF